MGRTRTSRSDEGKEMLDKGVGTGGNGARMVKEKGDHEDGLDGDKADGDG